jgi:hypothetical protein
MKRVNNLGYCESCGCGYDGIYYEYNMAVLIDEIRDLQTKLYSKSFDKRDFGANTEDELVVLRNNLKKELETKTSKDEVAKLWRSLVINKKNLGSVVK